MHEWIGARSPAHVQNNVVDLALEIAGDLRDLYGRGQAPTEADMIKGIDKIIRRVGKAVDQSAVSATVKQLTHEPGLHGQTSPAPSLGGLASLPVLVMAIIVLIRRKQGSARRSDPSC